ncbi:cell division protein [Bifidobacterium samirii]|uniref:Cell division protein n=1 Tax=Bifidobacterium samirii TaxID=2306974 RepID=A0A430FR97_9BIFI|nr:cell division protein [Bifidobacterium samirii]RSX55360.1 cell division protein [Bifidobacterium samirii]
MSDADFQPASTDAMTHAPFTDAGVADAAGRPAPSAVAAVSGDAADAGARPDGQSDRGDADARDDRRAAFPFDALPDLRDDPDAGSDPAAARSRDEFTTVYDIIDELESLLGEAKSGLFTPGVVKVDRDEFTDRLERLKAMLPVQLERASALMREAERRLETAQTQANAIVTAAQSRAADTIKDADEQARFLAGQENVTALARQKARAILDQAQSKADRLTQGADRYCVTVMEGLQQQLGKLDRDVQAGLNVLYERQRTAAEQLPHLDHNDYPEV